MINVLTDPAVGGTFLSWSIHYLAGHQHYFSVLDNQWINLVNNPLTPNNAHSFKPNQPNRIYNCSQNVFEEFAQKLDSAGDNQVLYFHSFEDHNMTKFAVNYVSQKYQDLIAVDTSKYPLYHCSYRKRSTTPIGPDNYISDHKEIQQHFIKKYFKNSSQTWAEQGLSNLWDIREFIALNFKPMEKDPITDYVDKTKQCLVIQGTELWNIFDLTVDNLFDYLDLPVAADRFDSWAPVYYKWRTFHRQRFLFLTYFDDIIDSIINNYNIDLQRFNLDIEQEAAIQHVLIYNHGLNFKTWQLEKFTNTQQLHSLLEPNIHSLSS